MVKFSNGRLSLVLGKEEEHRPVGLLLREKLGLSSAHIRKIKWLEDGIFLDGNRVTTRARGREGQTLSALLSEEKRTSSLLPRYGEIDIVYEDTHLVVINKETGVVVHPSPGHYDDTLGNFLLYHYDKTGFRGDFHPVHRLDSGTSGLLVVAKHPFAQEMLTKQMRTPVFFREYLALCWGVLEPQTGEIHAPIYSDTTMKRTVHHEKGQPALTCYRVLQTGEIERQRVSLVLLRLKTGRTHQIRVHLAYLGCPLVGDALYGFPFHGREHQALHAHKLGFVHPVTQEEMRFHRPPPQGFLSLAPWITPLP